jgi:hypothetical protein
MTFSGASRLGHSRSAMKPPSLTAGKRLRGAGQREVIPKKVARKRLSRDTNYNLGIPPPPGIMLPMPRIILAMPPLVENFFIIFCICLCCLIRRPMSCT